MIIPPWYHIGRFLTDRLAPGVCPDLRDAISIGIGFAILSYIVMLLGILGDSDAGFIFGLVILSIIGGYSKTILLALIILPFLLTLPLTWKRIRNLPSRLSQWSSDFNLPGDRFIWLILGILFLLDLVNCGNAAVGWDAAVHHYAFPKALLRAGGLIDVPEITFSFYPSLGEMLFTLGLGISGEFFAGALTWIYLFPLAAGLLSIGVSLGNRRIGLWAIILFLGTPLTFENPFSGVIDLPFYTYCILALALTLEKKGALSWSRIILIGLLIGCACASKHLGLLFLAAFVPILIWVMIARSGKIGLSLANAVVIAIVALLVPLPWYIRSFLATGDPLYPYLGNLLLHAGSQAGSFSVESFARTDYPRSLPGFIGYLWHLTMNYWDQRQWFLAIHPAYLALLPPAIVWAIIPGVTGKPKNEILSLRIILVLAILTMAINFLLAPAYPRYLFPTWLCLSLISAWTLAEINRTWPIIGRVIIPIVLTLPFIVVMGMSAKRAIEVIPQYYSEDARHNAIVDKYAGYETFIWANENLDPAKSLILSIDPKIYYLNSPAIIAKPGIESSLIVPWDSQPPEILANWRELGVTHFILDTTLLSVKHGFGIAFFSAILDDRDAVWLDIETTRAGAVEFGIGDILTDEGFLYMSELGKLPIVHDGTREGRHLFTREKMELFQSWGRDWRMAGTLLKLIHAGILVEESRSGTRGGLRIYSVHLPTTDDIQLPDLPDVSEWCLPYEQGPIDRL